MVGSGHELGRGSEPDPESGGCSARADVSAAVDSAAAPQRVRVRARDREQALARDFQLYVRSTVLQGAGNQIPGCRRVGSNWTGRTAFDHAARAVAVAVSGDLELSEGGCAI